MRKRPAILFIFLCISFSACESIENAPESIDCENQILSVVSSQQAKLDSIEQSIDLLQMEILANESQSYELRDSFIQMNISRTKPGIKVYRNPTNVK